MRTTVFLLLFLFVLAGCARTPSYSPEFPAYAAKRVESQKETPPFEKAANIPEKEPTILSLQECIAIALKNNPEFAAVQSDVEAAQARLTGAKAALWPKVSAVGGYTRYKDDVRLIQATYNGEPALYTDEVLSGDIVLTLSLFSGGQTYNQILASDLLRLSSENKMAFSREELTYNVTSLYFTLIAQKKVIESLDSSYKSLSEEANRIQQMIAAQKAAKVDLLRAQVRVADVKQRRIAEQNSYVTTRLALINLMGIALPENMLVLAETLQIPTEAEHASPPSLENILRNRQDYKSAENAVIAQEKLVSVAQGGFSPEIYVKGSYGHRRSVGSTVASPADKQGELGNVGVFFELPLFTGGSTLAKVREEKAKLQAAKQRLERLRKQIDLEVQTAFLSIHAASARIESARTALEQAEESFRIERMKYELGKGTIIDTLDAEASLLQANVTYYRALADYHIAVAKLRFASGVTL